MIDTSAMSGTLVSSYTPSASRLAAISLSTEFLAPGTSDRPLQRAEVADRDLVGRDGSGVDVRQGTEPRRDQYAPGRDRAGGSRSARVSVRRSSAVARPERRAAEHVARPAAATTSCRANGADGDRPRSCRTPGRSPSTSAAVEPRRRRLDARGDDHLPVRAAVVRLAVRAAGALDDRPSRPRPATVARSATARRGGRRPTGSTPRQLSVLGLLAAASMSSAFINTLFTQTVEFAADDFGVGDSGIGVAGAVVRAGIVLVLPVAALADRIGRRRVIVAVGFAAPMSRPPGRSRRRSRSSSPPRRSAGRSGWRSTSWSPSSPPRRCRATPGRTPSACWRWPAGSAPAWLIVAPARRPRRRRRGASSTSCR